LYDVFLLRHKLITFIRNSFQDFKQALEANDEKAQEKWNAL